MHKLVVSAILVCSVSLAFADGYDRGAEGDHAAYRIPMVFDAQGKVVGALASFYGLSGVFLNVNGAIILAPIVHRARDFTHGQLDAERSASEFQWANADSLPYASSDCSGNPLVPQLGNSTDTSGPRPTILVRNGVDVTAYVAADAYSQRQVIGSYRDFSTASVGACNPEFPTNFTVPAWPLGSTYPISQHYPEPLRIGF